LSNLKYFSGSFLAVLGRDRGLINRNKTIGESITVETSDIYKLHPLPRTQLLIQVIAT
jgi:hypothetical protein